METNQPSRFSFFPCNCGLLPKHGFILDSENEERSIPSHITAIYKLPNHYLNFLKEEERISDFQYKKIVNEIEVFFMDEINKRILVGIEP